MINEWDQYSRSIEGERVPSLALDELGRPPLRLVSHGSHRVLKMYCFASVQCFTMKERCSDNRRKSNLNYLDSAHLTERIVLGLVLEVRHVWNGINNFEKLINFDNGDSITVQKLRTSWIMRQQLERLPMNQKRVSRPKHTEVIKQQSSTIKYYFNSE